MSCQTVMIWLGSTSGAVQRLDGLNYKVYGFFVEADPGLAPTDYAEIEIVGGSQTVVNLWTNQSANNVLVPQRTYIDVGALECFSLSNVGPASAWAVVDVQPFRR